MQPLPSINALRSFQTSARCLSFTQAARELHVTQGAVSHQVKALEELLGVALFLRVKQKLQLTELGRGYLSYVSEALALLQNGHEYLTGSKQSGILTVSVSPNFASKWLVHRLGSFINAHPDIELRISASMGHVDLLNSDIDLAIRHGDNHWPDLHVTKLCSETIFPVCSPSYLDQHPKLQQPTDLTKQVLLHDRSRRDWPRWFAFAGMELSELAVGPQFDQTSMVLDAAVEGQGVALARSALAARDLLSGRLLRLFPQAMPAPFGYYLVCSKAAANHSKVQRFIAWVLEQAEEEVSKLQAHS
ncbi:MAG: transcriptional regulator GcvA [Pseudomonadales bacterium]|nr:transcriptional regulator GcvA [Pseudomonadales bacterium]